MHKNEMCIENGDSNRKVHALVGRGSFRRLIRNKRKMHEAAAEIVSALYLNDRSDFVKALWSSLRILDEDLCKIAETDLKAAFEKCGDLPTDIDFTSNVTCEPPNERRMA